MLAFVDLTPATSGDVARDLGFPVGGELVDWFGDLGWTKWVPMVACELQMRLVMDQMDSSRFGML